ncbi:MAG: metallophosphoesterase [Deltaproteobacteria bacterium]|nr:metallophosphoesterase [Deltaproteobacteria bacterium]
MSYTLILKTLVCHVTEDDTGSDETYLKVNGKTFWGPHDMNNGHIYHLDKLIKVSEEGDIKIQLYDEDAGWLIDPDDYLGTATLKPEPGERMSIFRKDECFYSLFYSIEKEGVPAELEIVKPSLGNPFVCKPDALFPFTITVATRSQLGDIKEAIQQMATSVILEDAETGEKWGCLAAAIQPSAIIPKRQEYRKLRAELNQQPDRFPRTNAEFKAGCGIVTDFQMCILPFATKEQLAGARGWPKMFNLHLGDKVVRNCIFASETLIEKNSFKFLQVTDTHVTVFYDTLTSHIRNYPNISEETRKKMLRAYRNPNDHLRAIIRYANEEKIDFMVITGDLVNWVSDGFLQYKPREHTNFRKFYDIITGADGIGERLRCPVFTIAGNHDFYPFRIPLRFEVSGITDLDKELKPTGLKEYIDILEDMGKYYGTPVYGTLQDIPSTSAYTLLINIYPQFFQYLMELSYDVSYSVEIGKHTLVFLNTGAERGGPTGGQLSKRELAEGYALGSYNDYIQDGPHCQGFSDEDARILKDVMRQQDNTSGLTLIFTHAPLVNLEGNPDKDLHVVFEDNHQKTKSPPPYNEITTFFHELEPAVLVPPSVYVPVPPLGYWPILKSRGYSQGETRYFYCFPQNWSKQQQRDDLIDFNCAFGEGFGEVLQVITGTHPDIHHYRANIIVFSGHTHHIAEYRATGPQQLEQNGPCIFTENYSGSAAWTKLPEGNKSLQLPQNQADIGGWRRHYAPLLLISGGLKGKNYPQFREIHVEGTGLHAGVKTLKMKRIARWEGSKIIQLRSSRGSGDYMFAQDSQHDISMAIAQGAYNNLKTVFELVELGGSKVALIASNGQYVRAKDGGGGGLIPDRSQIRSHETFKLIKHHGGGVSLQAHDGHYVRSTNDSKLVVDSSHISEWETFLLIDGAKIFES